MNRFISLLLVATLLTNFVWADESLDASFSNPTDLTDQEVKNSQEFVHQGVKDRVIKEGCEKLNDCSAEEKGMPIESMIGKAYSLIFGTMVTGLTKKKTDVKVEDKPATDGKPASDKPDAGDKNAKSKDDKQTDYCIYIAMTYETLAMFMQQNQQSKADKAAAGVNDIQLQSLINLKETHKARKTTATYQAAIYGSVSACYAAMAFTGKAQTDWRFFAKLGGATALTGLYIKKAAKHANASKAVQKVIDSLPKSGQCNPWTNTPCFCKESTSKDLYPTEYQSVCVLNNGDIETPKVATGCGKIVNNAVTYDSECSCKQTNSCLKTSMTGFTGNIGTGANFMNAANQGFDLLSNGTADTGALADYANGAAAMTNKLKPKTDTTPKVNLTDAQKKEAEELKPVLGNLANLAAASRAMSAPGGIQDSAKSSSAAINKLSPEIKEKLAEGIKGNYRKGNSGFNASSESNDFVFPGLPTAAPQANNNTEILTFAEQAVMNADVSNKPETPIFDIISNRYRRSAWERLEDRNK